MFIFFETSYAVVNLMVYGKSYSGLLDAAFLFYQSNTSFFLSLDLKGEPESYKYLFRSLWFFSLDLNIKPDSYLDCTCCNNLL